MGTFPITGGPGNRARIPWILVNPGSGGVPGADETRNPGIGDPQLDQGTLVGHPPPPLPVGTGFLGPLCGPGSPIMIYDC